MTDNNEDDDDGIDWRTVAEAEAVLATRAAIAALLVVVGGWLLGWLEPTLMNGLLAFVSLVVGGNLMYLYIKWRHPELLMMADMSI